MIVFGLLRGGIYGNAHVDFFFPRLERNPVPSCFSGKITPPLQNSYTAANEALLVMLGQPFCALTGVLISEVYGLKP